MTTHCTKYQVNYFLNVSFEFTENDEVDESDPEIIITSRSTAEFNMADTLVSLFSSVQC